MVHCKVCGKEITAEDEFCPHCGMRAQKAAPAPTPVRKDPVQATVAAIPKEPAPAPVKKEPEQEQAPAVPKEPEPPPPPKPDYLKMAREYYANNKKKVTMIGGIAALALVCIIALVVVFNVAVPAFKYSKAETLLSGGQYDEAIAAFAALTDYKDAAEREKDAKYQRAGKLLADQYYNLAVDAYTELGSYKDAPSHLKEAQYQKAGSLIAAEDYVSAIATLEKIKGYKDANDLAKEAKYRQAKNLLNAKDYMGAYTAFDALGTYKDSAQLKFPLQFTLVKNRQISTIQFGTCEWKVLKVEGEKALVIATEYVASKPEEEVEAWLNGDFYNLFRAEEKAKIITTEVEIGGEKANKRVWLLSESEARTYFTTNDQRKVGYKGWYLRDGFVSKNGVIGYDKDSDEWGFSANVYFNISAGAWQGFGNYLKAGSYGVRPALWLKLDMPVAATPPKPESTANALHEFLLEGNVLLVGNTMDFEPFGFYAEDNKTRKGFDVELAEEIGKIIGVPVRFVDIEFDYIFDNLGQKYDCAISGLSYTAEREKRFGLSTPYFEGNLPDGGTDMLVAFTVKENLALLDEINRAIGQLEDSGQLDALRSKWLS